MNPWIEIYDNEQVQWHLRQQVTNHGATIVAALSLAVLAWSIAGLRIVPHQMLMVGISIAALGAACWTATKILRLRNRVWCIKMSPHMVMGYDYRRSAVTVSWSEVVRVDVTDEAIVIACEQGRLIEIPNIFPDYAHVSHRIIDLTELHKIPVYIGGRSMLDTDILVFLPELSTLFGVPSISSSASG